jgi:hypothetical protein
MISTVTLSFDLTYRNPSTGALEPRGIVTDSTDYAGLGIDLLLAEAKGLGVITFNGDVIVNRDAIINPMIDLQNWGTLNPGQTPVFDFPLELDLNGNVANGVYTFEYSLRLNMALIPFTVSSITLPNTLVVDTTDSWLANFLEVGDSVILLTGAPATIDLVASAVFNDPNITITTSTPIDSDLYTQLSFNLTNVQFSGVFTYSGCTQTTADVSFTYDCEVGDSGSWAVANTTKLASNEVVSTLNCTVSYPSWTALTPTFNPQVVLTSLPYPSAPNTETPLATGTYTVSLTQQIQQNQTDGLILLYTTSTAQEFVVSCSGSLCGLTPCIESLRVAHANELHRNRISKYQVFVDNVLLYYAEAQNYRACGDTANYRATLELIKQNLDSSGCECACCDENLFYFVSNNSGVSVIDSLIQSFQFRLFSLTPPAAGSPLLTDDVTQGVQEGAIWENTFTNVLYICLDNTVNNAQWVEFFNYQETFTAAQISAVSGINLNTNNVQGQLNQADALFTIIDLNTTDIESDIADLQAGLADLDGINGLTRVGDDFRLGGTLDATTVINADNNIFEIISDNEPLSVRAGDGTCLLAARAQTANTGVGQNLILETTSTSGNGANGLGSSIFFTAAPASSPGPFPLSTIESKWTNATNRSSDVTISSVNAGVENVGITLNANSSLTLNEYGAGTFTGTAAYSLAVDASGNVIETTSSSGPLVYIGKVTGNGPTASITQIFNNTGATISFGQFLTGEYILSASSAVFTSNKTGAFITPVVGPAFVDVGYFTNQINVNTYNASGVLADLVANMVIKVEIYP